MAEQQAKHGSGYVDVVLGAQLGDEGKGRFIDMLSRG